MRTHSLPSLLDRLFVDFDEGRALAPAPRSFQPPLDLAEFPDRYEVVTDLPGAKQEEVTVEFTDGALQIRGELASEATPDDGRVLRRERPAGRFARTVAFRDEIDVEQIEATFRDGVLRVSVPKSERNQPRQIPVEIH